MNPLRATAVKIGSIPWMPTYLPQIVKCDSALQKLTGHRVGLLDIATLPNITMEVVGRSSGVVRTTRLLAVPDGDDWVIAGSYFGGPKMPQWVFNVRAADTVEISRHRRSWTAVPTELDGPDREQAWQLLRAVWPNFDLYEQRTDRRIPVFRLRPAEPT
ncbi:nitroreductase family deazaflavin-dependent oxidoreductase [Gordonia sp. ABSL49_1]|uniref:nitroreductase family deazaflavin-dependent oxidoreductase n=1 Tax=Gordonia sp. ABSL49_1 TaxID=2920941 RepID=UPI001F0D2BFC|nr:nitroreductase family deazaflavin-dependent oxidoreductase [Gordonia sp. ABSL49_1]MCH5642635.1 nitroreductase family deazaflavin-dependent oxidoreductase [Gordonia sp. ABSL49_1]